MVEIRHMLLIDAPVDTVYRAVTEPKGLAGWWTVQALATPDVGSTADFKYRIIGYGAHAWR